MVKSFLIIGAGAGVEDGEKKIGLALHLQWSFEVQEVSHDAEVFGFGSTHC